MSSTEEVLPTKPATVAAWKKAGVHSVLLPSGTRIEIRIPDLAALIERGEIPQNLLDAAIQYVDPNVEPEKPTRESIARDKAFRDSIILYSSVTPKLAAEDIDDIPSEDKDMIVDLALRQRDRDAEGEVIGGLMASAKFRKFRGYEGFDEVLEDA